MPLIDGLSRRQMRLLAMQALINAKTMAEDRVYEPRDWPTDPEFFPMLLVSTPRERKVPLSAGQLAYTTTVGLVVVGRLLGSSAEVTEDELDMFAGQVVEALTLDPDFDLGIEQRVAISTQIAVNAEGKYHVGEFGMTFEVSFYQAYGPTGPDLIDITGTIPVGTGVPIIFDVKREDTP